jgi:peptidase C25-like protein
MRPNPLSTLLLCSLSTLLALLASSARPDLAAASALPPGIAADLARDQGVPQPGEGPFPYVIVTGRALRNEFMTLARERIRNGTPSRVRSLESLQSDYPVAADDAERVRLFLRDAHQHWGTRWVLLGGDTDVLPPRYASVLDFLGNRSFVCDWYYACLEGTWDGDGDGRYGEPPSQEGPGDAADMIPELFVGRAPVSTHHEARDFVDKTLAYERRPDDGFEHTTLMFGNLFVGIDFAFYAELLLPVITDDPAQQVTRLYEGWDNPRWSPGALPETRQSVLDALGQGRHMVVGFGVGGPTLLAAGTQEGPDPQTLTVPDVLGLANGDRAGHVVLLTSLVSAFDTPTSLGEAFLRAPAGGAVTVIAPSDITFITLSFVIVRRLVELAFEEGVGTIGEALVSGRAGLVASGFVGSPVLAYQLLGDPLLRVFRQPPVAAAGNTPDHGRTAIAGLGRPGDEGTGKDVVMSLPPAIASAAVPRGERREPTWLRLSTPVPSPAVSYVRVECAMPGAGAGATLDAAITDLAGRAVRTLAGEVGTAGAATVRWDLRDSQGRRVSPGVYFMRVRAGGSSRTTRLVVAAGP